MRRQANIIGDQRLAALITRVENDLADLYAYLAEAGRLPPRVSGVFLWPDLPSHPDLMSPAQAALEAAVTPQTIRRWSEQHGIGKKYGKRLRVSRLMLQPMIERSGK